MARAVSAGEFRIHSFLFRDFSGHPVAVAPPGIDLNNDIDKTKSRGLLHFSIIEPAAVLGFLIFISPPVMNYSGVFPILFEYTEQNLTGGSSVYQAIFTEVNITLVETAFDFVDGFHRYSCLAQAGAQA